MQNFLTIDNGGTNTKAVIFDQQGHQLGVGAFPTRDVAPKEGFHELELQHLLSHLAEAVQNALQAAQIDPVTISGITTVGHGKGLYLLNKDKKPFTNGILSADHRAQTLAESLEERVDEIYPLTHQHVVPSQAPVLLRWLKLNQPTTYAQIGAVLSNKDFIRYLLTGDVLQERGDASGNNLINLDTGDYDSRLTAFFGISEIDDALPPLVNATDLCGHLIAPVASQLGLPVGIPVFGGLFDIDACAIATGVLDETTLSVIAGTWNMNLVSSERPADQHAHVMNSLLPTGKYLVEASSPTSAGNLNLMTKLLMTAEIRDATANGQSIYNHLETLLETTDANFAKAIFYPFLYGTNQDPAAEASFIGLQSSTTKSELMRAVYEGICFAHRQHVEQLIAVMGYRPAVIRLSGGATNSPGWVQMFADVLGLPVELTNATELGGLGGAMAIAIGLGEFSTFSEAVNSMAHRAQRFEPNAKWVPVYSKKYAIYQGFARAMNSQWAALNAFREETIV